MAVIPMFSKGGRRPMAAVGSAMPMIDSDSAFLRPKRSPMALKIKAPMGRMKKLTLKTARAERTARPSSSLGKNVFPMKREKWP